jgi:hypothetical protein
MNSAEKNPMLIKCIAPPPLSDEELMAALDNEAPPQVLSHLEICLFCSERLGEMRHFEQSLRSGLYRFECPAPDKLGDYFLGTLEMPDRQDIQDHLNDCPLCQRELEDLQAFFALDEEEDRAPASDSISLWEQIKETAYRLEDQLVRILMPENTLAYGVLKSRSPQGHQMTYNSGPVSLLLTLEKVIEGLKITGTIVDTEAEGRWRDGHVELIRMGSDSPAVLATVDEDEMFVVESLSPGRFNVNIYAAADHILKLLDLEIQL